MYYPCGRVPSGLLDWPAMPPAPTADSGTYRPYTQDAPAPSRCRATSSSRTARPRRVRRGVEVRGPRRAAQGRSSSSPAEADDGRGGERFAPGTRRLRADQGDPPPVPAHPGAGRAGRRRTRHGDGAGRPPAPGPVPRVPHLRAARASRATSCSAYFADAAEALDMIAAQVRAPAPRREAGQPVPRRRAREGRRLRPRGAARPDGGGGNRGLTPKYVAPEVLHGEPSTPAPTSTASRWCTRSC